MISCDAVSSLLAKVLSICKAAVCSTICSYTEDALSIHGPDLVHQVRKSPVIHILSPMIRQIREMNNRLPKRRKTTLDENGNIIVDQYEFRFNDWSTIVPRTVAMLEAHIRQLVSGIWWERIVDLASPVQITVDSKTGDLILQDVRAEWKNGNELPMDSWDSLAAILEMAFHGFGGGAARMAELKDPTMFHCIFTNHTIYYSLSSIKTFNHASRNYKEVERKLPPVIARYFLLFRSFIQRNKELFSTDAVSHLFPSRVNRSTFGPANVKKNLFCIKIL